MCGASSQVHSIVVSLPEFQSLPRVWFCAGTEPDSRQTGFFAESQTKSSRHRKKHSPKISLPRAKQKTLGKENLKKHFFASNFFLSSTFAYTKLMLKFGTISSLFAIFKNFTPF
jgi:hypothetical protein